MRLLSNTVCVATLAVLNLAGCINGGESAARSAKPNYDPLVEAFGRCVLRGDWARAYAMTTPQFQAVTSQAELRHQYEAAVAEVTASEPTYRPTIVEVGHGDLPGDEREARDLYGIRTAHPMSSWRAWLFCRIGQGDADGLDYAVESRMLIVEESAKARIGYVEFGFPD